MGLDPTQAKELLAAMEAAGTPIPTQLSGSTLAENTKTQADLSGGAVAFSDDVAVLEIANLDASNTGTFVVNGVTVILPPGWSLEPTRFEGTPSSSVTVSGSTEFLMNRYK
jgi:hypothetical protein